MKSLTTFAAVIGLASATLPPSDCANTQSRNFQFLVRDRQRFCTWWRGNDADTTSPFARYLSKSDLDQTCGCWLANAWTSDSAKGGWNYFPPEKPVPKTNGDFTRLQNGVSIPSEFCEWWVTANITDATPFLLASPSGLTSACQSLLASQISDGAAEHITNGLFEVDSTADTTKMVPAAHLPDWNSTGGTTVLVKNRGPTQAIPANTVDIRTEQKNTLVSTISQSVPGLVPGKHYHITLDELKVCEWGEDHNAAGNCIYAIDVGNKTISKRLSRPSYSYPNVPTPFTIDFVADSETEVIKFRSRKAFVGTWAVESFWYINSISLTGPYDAPAVCGAQAHAVGAC